MKDILINTIQTLTNEEKSRAYLIIFLSIIAMFLETFGVSLIIPFVALILEDNIYGIHPFISNVLVNFGSPQKYQLLIYGFILLVSFFFIKSSFSSYLIFKQTRFAYNLRAEISKRLFRTYLNQPFKFFLNENSAKLIRNIRAETDLYIEIVINSSLILLSEVMIIIGIIILLLIFEPHGAILILSIVAAIFLSHQLLTKKITKKYAEIRQYFDGQCIKIIQQSLNSIISVKIQSNENLILSKFKEYADKSAQAQKFQTAMQELPRLWLEFFALLGLTILVLFLYKSGNTNNQIMTTIGLFGAAAFKILPSLNRVFVASQKLRFGQPVLSIILESRKLEKNIKYKIKDLPKNFSQNILNENYFLQLKNINFRYQENQKKVFSNTELNLEKNKRIGIYGESGSGKSTLINLISGLLKPNEGKILYYGVEIEKILGYYHSKLGYVSQNVTLMDESIKNNITFFEDDKKVDNQRIEKIIEILELKEFLNGLPNGLNSIVGENAVKISGGQKQRLGIARTLYHEPEILILDEATNALDSETERKIVERIFSIKSIKNIICISHKMSNLKFCDKIYKISKNEIVIQ